MTDSIAAAAAQAYADTVRNRLVALGFKPRDPASARALLVAEKSGVELTKFGNVDTVVQLGYLASPSVSDVWAFSAGAFNVAGRVKRGFRMPPGLFQALFVYTVAVVDAASPEVIAAVTTKQAPKHFAKFEAIAVFDLSRGRLHVFGGTPIWGAAYARSSRKFQEHAFA
jgi:hypothetical protein